MRKNPEFQKIGIFRIKICTYRYSLVHYLDSEDVYTTNKFTKYTYNCVIIINKLINK